MPDLDELNAIEAEADRAFGVETRPVRVSLGLLIGYLHELGGPDATRNYVQKCLKVIRSIDLLDSPPPEAPKAS
jgi:hypothetical protein